MIVKDNNFKQLSAQNATFSNINTQSLTVNGIPFNSTSSDILTSSGIIPSTNTSTFFETYKSYSLDGSQLPKFILASGIPNQKINLNLLNPRSGNVNVKTNKGSFNLTFDNQNVDLQYINTNWVQTGAKSPWFVNEQQGNRLIGSGASGGSLQGWTVSLSADGNTLAVGGPWNDLEGTIVGATWIFTRSGTTWTQQGNKLIGTEVIDTSSQGISVSLSADGNTLAVGGGAINDDLDLYFGATWIFTRSGTTWTQQGNKLIGTGATNNPLQGYSVSLSPDGNTLAVGGPKNSEPWINVGATWIFTRSGTTWTQQGNRLIGTGYSTGSLQGTSVSLSADGNTLAVGGPWNDEFVINDGATWIFTRSGTTWTQQGNKLIGTGATETSSQGKSVSLSGDGNTLAVGGFSNDEFGTNVGATWIFTRSGTTWTQQGNRLIGTGYSGESFQGWSVSLSADGNTLAVGGPGNNVSGTVGATWIFTRSGNPSVWTQQGNRLIGSGITGDPRQGSSVSLSADGNTLAVGGRTNDEFGLDVGATWVFI